MVLFAQEGYFAFKPKTQYIGQKKLGFVHPWCEPDIFTQPCGNLGLALREIRWGLFSPHPLKGVYFRNEARFFKVSLILVMSVSELHMDQTNLKMQILHAYSNIGAISLSLSLLPADFLSYLGNAYLDCWLSLSLRLTHSPLLEEFVYCSHNFVDYGTCRSSNATGPYSSHKRSLQLLLRVQHLLHNCDPAMHASQIGTSPYLDSIVAPFHSIALLDTFLDSCKPPQHPTAVPGHNLRPRIQPKR